MSNQKLRLLLWQHYRVLLITAVVALALAGLKEGLSVVNQPQVYVSGGQFTLETGGALRVLVTLAVYFALGLTVFLHDNWTNFNHYLFSLPVARQRIYRQKIGLLVTSTTVGYVLMQLIYGLIVQTALPQRHAYFYWGNSWMIELCQLAMLTVLLMVAVTFGLWVGHIFASVVSGIVFCCSLLFAYNGILFLISKITGINSRRLDLLNNVSEGTWPGMLIILGICLVLGGFLYWMNGWGFDHLSLENSREFFRFPELRGAVLWFSIVYLMIAISCSEFGIEILGLLTDNYRQSMPLGTGILMAIVVGYLTWSLGRWFLYRPDRFRDAWTFRRLV